jgi:hypothetical protein
VSFFLKLAVAVGVFGGATAASYVAADRL